MAEVLIRVKDLEKTYTVGETEIRALGGVTLDIRRGEFVAVMGASGSGKSTFLNLLACLDRPSSGSYLLDGKDVSRLSDDERADVRSNRIGFVFQSFHLLPRMSASDNVALPFSYLRNGRDTSSPDLPARLLDMVGLPHRTRHRPAELSGGEQQRVALARALANNPSVILADEPTGNLDTGRSREIMRILSGLNNAGITVVLVTHEEDIARYARRLVRFRDGEIVSDESIEQSPEIRAARIDADFTVRPPASVPVDPAPRNARGFRSGTAAAFRGHLHSAVATIWHNRLRSLLTALGILIGVAAVIAMMAVGRGSQKDVESRIQQLGSNLLTVMPGSSRSGRAQGGFGSAESLTIQDAEAIARKVPGLASVAPEVSLQGQVQYGRNNWNTTITGTTAAYPAVHSWAVSAGRFFTQDDSDGRRMVCVIGSDIASTLYGSDNPVGTTLRIREAGYRVIGVMASRGGSGFGNEDDIVFVPITTAMSRLTGRKYIRSIAVSVANRNDMDVARNEITTLLMLRHGIPAGADADFTVFSQEDILDAMKGVSRTLTLLLASVAGISLLVGGIGIMNIMLVSVTERTREIGLRKAVGARRSDIMAQFLTEAIVLSGMGGVAGWLVGVLAARLIQVIGSTTTVVTPVTIILALGFSVAVGVFFGIVPARKAARLDPIESLRHE